MPPGNRRDCPRRSPQITRDISIRVPPEGIESPVYNPLLAIPVAGAGRTLTGTGRARERIL